MVVQHDEPGRRDLVFVSYSHKDRQWLERLLTMLTPYVDDIGSLAVWEDDKIVPGSYWAGEIEEALSRAAVALLLVSDEFLDSGFITTSELPPLLRDSRLGLTRVLCVPVTSSGWKKTELGELQWLRDGDKPLDLLRVGPRKKALREICDAIDPLLPLAPERELSVAEEDLAAVALAAQESLGELHEVPPLPLGYLERRQVSQRLIEELRSAAGRLVGVKAERAMVGLHGLGGVGKTVAAMAVANSREVRELFPDGVFWVTLGARADLVARQLDLARRLGEPEPAIGSLTAGREVLSRLLAGKRALVIVDDVWSVAAAGAFAAAGPLSRVLYTTRNETLLERVGARSVNVEAMHGAEARRYLARSAGIDSEARLPDEAVAVIEATGGIALAMATVGASIRHGASWPDVVSSLEEGKEVFGGHPFADTFKAIQTAVASLGKDRTDLYRQLAIYPEDEEIPVRDVRLLWSQTAAMSDEASDEFIADLANRHLLRWNHAADTVSFHDLQRDFVLLEVDDQALLHADLVEAYRQLLTPVDAGTGWGTLPPENRYAARNLVYHLRGAGNEEEAFGVCVDPAFLALQISLEGSHAAEATLFTAIELRPASEPARHLESQVRQWGHLFRAGEGLADTAATLRGLLATHLEWEATLEPLIGRPSLRSRWPAPSVTAMLIRVLAGPGGRVGRVVFSPDGCVLAAAGPFGDWESDFVRVWKAIDGTPVLELRVLDGVKALEFSPSGDALAIASSDDDGRVRLRNLIDASRGPDLEADGVGSTRLIVFSPDEPRIATASGDGKVRLWDRSDGSPGPVLDHGARVTDVTFTPDGARLISAGDDHRVRVWDASDGTLESVHDLRWVSARHGTRLASAHDDGTVLVWDAADAESTPVAIEGHHDGAKKLAFSPDGALLASAGSDGTVRLWDATDGAPSPALHGQPGRVKTLSFLADGAKLARTSFDGTVLVWDLTDPSSGPAVVVAPTTGQLAISPDGTRLASGDTDGSFLVWDLADVASGPVVAHGHNGRTTQLVFSPDGTRLASGGDDGAVRLWDPGRLLGSDAENHRGGVTQVAFSRDGARLVSVGDDGTVRWWDATDGTPGSVQQLDGVLSPHATRLASSQSDGTVLVWDVAEVASDPLVLKGHPSEVKSLVFSPDETRLVSSSADGAIHLWDAIGGTQLVDPFDGRAEGVWSVAWSPDGVWVAVGDSYGNVRLWDTARTGHGPVLAGHHEEVNQVVFSPDGAWLASTSFDGRVQLWDPSDGTPGRVIPGRRDDVNRVVFSPDGSRLASIRKTGGAVLLWDLTSGTPNSPVAQLPTGSDVSQAVFSPDSGRLATASQKSGTVALWDAGSGAALSALRPASSITSLEWHDNGLIAAAGDAQVSCLEVLEPATVPGGGI